jgi:hypothetical protein
MTNGTLVVTADPVSPVFTGLCTPIAVFGAAYGQTHDVAHALARINHAPLAITPYSFGLFVLPNP